MYRSSFPIVAWSLNDDDYSLTKAIWSWADRTSELPQDGTPGQEVEWSAPSGYEEPTRDGFEFAGWSTNPSAPAGGFLNAEPAITMPKDAPEAGEYTLYALWTPLEYSVVFELAKNPDVGDGPSSEGSFALNWSTEDGVRTVTSLGNGRYLVSGFTMKESGYDPVTRTVALPEPARTGYRFLGWAESEDASSLVVDGPDGTFELNPVRLPQIDGTPVLTARWTSALGVTAPLSITFGDYDKLGMPDNPSMGEEDVRVADDTVQSEADDTLTPGLSDQERYERLGQAYFENTGWNDPIRMVAITSERTSNANEVLTTYDSKKATEAAVLGDGTATNPGERLLSLYPSATEPSDKTTGVHFRLSDNLLEEDLAVLPSLNPSSRQPVTFGLNLANDPVTGSENHGLVLETEEYEPKQIATITYTFAVADAAAESPECLVVWNANGGAWSDGTTVTTTKVEGGTSPVPPSAPTGAYASFAGWAKSDFATSHLNLGSEIVTTATTYYAVYNITAPLYIHVTATMADIGTPGIYGVSEIKAAANDLAANAADPTKSRYYSLYRELIDRQVMVGGSPGRGPYFKLKVNGVYWDLQLIGICQDTKTAGGKAGLTFQLRDIFVYGSTILLPGTGSYESSYMNSSSTNAGGWNSSYQRTKIRDTFYNYLDATVRSAIVPVTKYQQLSGGTTAAYLQKTTNETVWLPSAYEVFGAAQSGYNESEALTTVAGYVPFQYMAYQPGGAGSENAYAVRRGFASHFDASGMKLVYWLRSAQSGNNAYWCLVRPLTMLSSDAAVHINGIVPCFCL